MDFDLSDDLTQPIGLARDFAREVLRPAEEAIDRIADPVEAYTGETHRDVTRKMRELDLHKLGFPTHLGGLGLPGTARFMIDEEIAVGGAGLASQLVLTPLAASLITMFGLDSVHDLYKDYLEAYLDDVAGAHSGAWTITEPDVGSDIFTFGAPAIRMRARATPGGAGYVIEGTKAAWCSNGWLADMIMTMVCLDPSAGMEGTATFLIPAEWPGVRKGRPIDKVGLRAEPVRAHLRHGGPRGVHDRGRWPGLQADGRDVLHLRQHGGGDARARGRQGGLRDGARVREGAGSRAAARSSSTSSPAGGSSTPTVESRRRG
ncbi:MAG: acyl-CoA dehydrogenase family protein [Acidimicrobiia bacterium]|nr:acyl-CoA dehydrogenase family protein [Acidimicrobiia bacterium]